MALDPETVQRLVMACGHEHGVVMRDGRDYRHAHPRPDTVFVACADCPLVLRIFMTPDDMRTNPQASVFFRQYAWLCRN